MPWRDPPAVDFEEEPEYRWSYWKVNMCEEDLFGVLHEQFNTASIFIQDPEAFHRDVEDIARQATDRSDFFSRLEDRKGQRLSEMCKSADHLDTFEINGHYDQMNRSQYNKYAKFRRYATLDSLIDFFNSFAEPNEKGQLPVIDRVPSDESQGAHRHFFAHGNIFSDSENNSLERTQLALLSNVGGTTPETFGVSPGKRSSRMRLSECKSRRVAKPYRFDPPTSKRRSTKRNDGAIPYTTRSELRRSSRLALKASRS